MAVVRNDAAFIFSLWPLPFATAAPILVLLCAKEIPKRWSTLVDICMLGATLVSCPVRQLLAKELYYDTGQKKRRNYSRYNRYQKCCYKSNYVTYVTYSCSCAKRRWHGATAQLGGKSVSTKTGIKARRSLPCLGHTLVSYGKGRRCTARQGS
jgi:hypothetical protein